MVLKISLVLLNLTILSFLNGVWASPDVTPAVRKDWPFSVIVSMATLPLCGGSLLSKQWVLTAAHCFDYQRWKIADPLEEEVGIGTVQLMPRYSYTDDDFPDNGLSMGSFPTFYSTAEIVTHPQLKRYNLSNFFFYAYDIALVKLEDAIPLSAAALMLPVRLAHEECNSFECSTAGWGIEYINKAPKDHDEKKNILYKIRLNRTCDDECTVLLEQLYPMRGENSLTDVFKDKMCATYQTETTIPDKVDEGSPLMCDGKQYGVLAMKTNIQDGSSILVFTKIQPYVPWIQKHIGSSKKSSPTPGTSSTSKKPPSKPKKPTPKPSVVVSKTKKPKKEGEEEEEEVDVRGSSAESIKHICVPMYLLFTSVVYYIFN